MKRRRNVDVHRKITKDQSWRDGTICMLRMPKKSIFVLCSDFIPRCGLIICSILSLLGWILILVSPSLHGILALYFGEYKIQLKMNTLQPTSPKWYQISSRPRSFPHWLRIRLLFTPHEHLCHWGKFQWFIINVIKGRFRLDVILNFFLHKPLGNGQIIRK